VSGPVRAPARDRSPRARTTEPLRAGLGGAIVLAAVGVFEHRLLDRVMRGRVWIGVVTFALLGIVTLQLALLELNGSIGRTLARKAQLMRANSELSVEDSALASDEHVMSVATQAGMVPVAINNLRFLGARGADPAHAAAALRTRVQPPASESASATAGASEASQGGESASPEASSTSSSSSSEAAGSSEASQSGAPAVQSSEGAASAGESSAASTPAVSEAGGSSAGGG
jgi:hypothetical protein